MSMTIEEYYAHPGFDPVRATFLDRMAAMKVDLARPWWAEQPSAVGKSLRVSPAVPGMPERPPTLVTFEPVMDTTGMVGNLLPMGFEQKPAWDTFGIGLLQRDPRLEPLWTELIDDNPFGSWSSYRSSSEFSGTVATLGLSARGLLGRGKKLLSKGARLVKKHAPAAGRFVTGLPTLTPTGVAAWVAKEVVVDAAIDWLQQQMKDMPPPRPHPGLPGMPPPIRPQRLAYAVPAAAEWGMPLAAPVDPLSSVLDDGLDALADMFGTPLEAVADVIDDSVDWLLGFADDLFN